MIHHIRPVKYGPEVRQLLSDAELPTSDLESDLDTDLASDLDSSLDSDPDSDPYSEPGSDPGPDLDFVRAEKLSAGGVRWVGLHVEGRLVGIAGLETYGAVGLLRSVVVDPDFRGREYGKALVVSAENMALQSGVETLYLLTETAENYFERMGYAHLPRSKAPAAIAGTTEFADVCPASAAFMRKNLAEVSDQRGVNSTV